MVWCNLLFFHQVFSAVAPSKHLSTVRTSVEQQKEASLRQVRGGPLFIFNNTATTSDPCDDDSPPHEECNTSQEA